MTDERPYVGRGRPRKGAPRREGMQAEARRRGITVWQVRRERGATWRNPGTTSGGHLRAEMGGEE